jgi:hypothetical protein
MAGRQQQPTLTPPPSRTQTVREDIPRRRASAHVDTRPIGNAVQYGRRAQRSLGNDEERRKRILPTLLMILSGLILMGIIAGFVLLIFFV